MITYLCSQAASISGSAGASPCIDHRSVVFTGPGRAVGASDENFHNRQLATMIPNVPNVNEKHAV